MRVQYTKILHKFRDLIKTTGKKGDLLNGREQIVTEMESSNRKFQNIHQMKL